jgi:hypothetical protein
MTFLPSACEVLGQAGLCSNPLILVFPPDGEVLWPLFPRPSWLRPEVGDVRDLGTCVVSKFVSLAIYNPEQPDGVKHYQFPQVACGVGDPRSGQ